MSVLKFELTEKHISLVKNVNWEWLGEDASKDDIYEELGLILYGKPDVPFDPTSPDVKPYTQEQMDEMDKLHSELPRALQIMLATGEFKTGHYKTKHHDINWVKIG